MSSTKEKRERLFKRSRPFVRPMVIREEDGSLSSDMGLLWVAYTKGGFPIPRGMSEQEFTSFVLSSLDNYDTHWVIEDDCKVYSKGRGPVCFIGVHVYGRDNWVMEPHVEWFPWATKKNVLRGTVGFLQMARYSKTVGACIVKSLANTSNLFHHMKEYGVLFYVGKIPNGDPRGDEYMFSIKGKRVLTGDRGSTD